MASDPAYENADLEAAKGRDNPSAPPQRSSQWEQDAPAPHGLEMNWRGRGGESLEKSTLEFVFSRPEKFGNVVVDREKLIKKCGFLGMMRQ